MNSIWKKHYRLKVSENPNDLFVQVDKTINGNPVDHAQLILLCDAIIQNLKLDMNSIALDLCCGNGLVTEMIAEHVGSVVGVDMSEELISVAKSQNKSRSERYYINDVLSLSPNILSQYTHIYMYEALQLFDQMQFSRLLASFAMSKTSQFLFASVPDFDRKYEYYDTAEKRKYSEKCELEGKPHMGKWWSKEEIKNIVSQNGLDVAFINQSPDLYTSYYRFDFLVTQ